MKSKSRLVAVFLPAILLSGCTDAAGRFDEFGKRITDAAPPEPDAAPIEQLPDINGYFLMSIAVYFIPEKPILFYQENVFTANDDGTGVVDVTVTPLTVADRQPIGDPLVSEGVVVSNAGTGAAHFVGVIPGPANPISGMQIELDCTAHFTIKSENFSCGDVTGSVTRPTLIDVEGSTMGSVRIAEDTYGEDLPDPVAACPSEDLDAGVEDAGTADADTTDAS